MDWQPGYPIDCRSLPMRSRAAADPNGDVEYAAGRIVARSTGARVLLADDNTQDAMPDLRIEYAGGRIGLGEVVTVTNEERAAEERAFAKGGLDLHDDGLNWEWWVTAPASVHRRQLLAGLPRVLAGMESACERPSRHVAIDRGTAGPGELRLLELGVTEVSADNQPGSRRGRVHWLPEGVGGDPAPDVDGFQSWLDEFLAGPVAAAKIAKINADPGDIERHLLIGVTWSVPWAVVRLLDGDIAAVPSEGPKLPAGLSHVWIWVCRSAGRALAWWPDRGWFDVATRWVTD